MPEYHFLVEYGISL